MNKTRKIIALCLIVSLVVSCTAFSYAVPELPASTSESSASEEELQLIAELSSDKYNHLLQVWSKDPNYPSDTDANFPDFYGGAYMDDNKELVIMVTSLDEEIIDYFGNLIDLEHVRFSLADHSFQELLDTQEAINNLLISNSLDEEVADLITGTGISCKENSAVVYTATEDFEDIRSSFSTVYSTKDSKYCNIIYCSLGRHFDFAPYSIAEQNDDISPYNVSGILVEPGGPICVMGKTQSGKDFFSTSVGFWAKNSAGQPGIVTAAHGVYSGLEVYASKTGDSPDEYFGYIGSVMESGAVDAAFVKRNTSDPERFPPLTYVEGWDFNLKSATKLMLEGEEIYKRGIETGATKGKVINVNYNPADNDSTGTNKLTSVVLTDCVVDAGDSGGIVAGGGTTSSRYVAGIVSGGIYRVGPLGQTTKVQMYYSKAPSILSALKLTLY